MDELLRVHGRVNDGLTECAQCVSPPSGIAGEACVVECGVDVWLQMIGGDVFNVGVKWDAKTWGHVNIRCIGVDDFAKVGGFCAKTIDPAGSDLGQGRELIEVAINRG